MAGLIPEGTITRILESTDIVDLISRYFPLKRAGQGFLALCPFHNEKTPSFHVSPQRQNYHCFGCGKGGNAIGFLMEMEKVPFPEAVELLAERCGIRLEHTAADGSSERRKALFDIMRAAQRHFERNLASDTGMTARDYLARRGISADSAALFHLGYAMPAWDDLLRKAQATNTPAANLEAAGLIISNNKNGHYDRFRNRLVFPIFNGQDKVVGFGARTLDPDEPVKYVNSPETALFTKGKLLYGLNLAKNEIIRTGKAVVVEGYTDVIMAHQHGITNVVATLGTALGREHVRQLRRYAQLCTLVYDGDAAGQKASDASLQVFIEEEMDVEVATLPGGKDPCEYLVDYGPDAFRKCLDAACGIFDFRLREAQGIENADPKKAAAMIDSVLALIMRIPNPVERRIRFDRVALLLGHRLQAEESSVRRRLVEMLRSGQASRARKEPAEQPPSAQLPPIEREMLTVCLQQTELFPLLLKEFGGDDFTHSGLRAVFEAARELHEAGDLQPARLSARLAEPALASLLALLLSDTDGSPDYPGRLEGCLQNARRQKVKKQISETKARMLIAEREGDEENSKRLKQEYTGLINIRGGIDG